MPEVMPQRHTLSFTKKGRISAPKENTVTACQSALPIGNRALRPKPLGLIVLEAKLSSCVHALRNERQVYQPRLGPFRDNKIIPNPKRKINSQPLISSSRIAAVSRYVT